MQFHLQAHIDKQLSAQQRRFSFSVNNPESFRVWQRGLRAALEDALGIAGRMPDNISQPELLSSEDKVSYIEEKHVFNLNGVSVPMYLLVPKAPPPYRAILAFHGHGMGVRQILGNYPNEDIAEAMIAKDENFAQQLAHQGYLVCAIEQQGFGERVTNQVSDAGNSCRHLAFVYLALGRTLLGERVIEGYAVISYLQSREDVRLTDLGCVGHSGGATTALFLSALDERIKAAIISGYFSDYRHTIFCDGRIVNVITSRPYPNSQRLARLLPLLPPVTCYLSMVIMIPFFQ